MMAPTMIVLDLEQLAEQDVITIKNSLAQAKECAYRLWDGGWKHLKDKQGNSYASFRLCIQDRFEDTSSTHVYRLKDARQVELDIDSVAASSDTPTQLKETHARVLRQLPYAQDKADALALARSIAFTEGDDEPVARHIEKAVAQVKMKTTIQSSPHAVIKNLVSSGSMSVEMASNVINELDKIPAQHQYDIQTMIAKHGGIADPLIIPELSKMLTRKNTTNPSLVLQWVEETGDFYETPFNKATIRDLNRAKWEATEVHKRQEHQKKATLTDTPVVEEIIATLYKGDPDKTAKVLQRLLGLEECKKLCTVLNDVS